jgi:putative ABC transport system permease protein
MFHDFKFALRILRSHPGATLLAAGALALGIGANCAIFSVIDSVILAPLGYRDPAHLYEIVAADSKKNGGDGSPVAAFEALSQKNGPIEKVSVNRFWSFTLTDRSGDAERIYAQAISSGTFDVLGASALRGRTFSPEDYRAGAPHVCVIAHRLWKLRYSGSDDVVGRDIELDGEKYKVVGVMPAEFQFPLNVYDLWTPWVFSDAERANHRDRGMSIYARLRPGATIAQAQAELDALADAMVAQFPATEKNWNPRIGPTKLGAPEDTRRQLTVLMGATGFVLLIACLNVANLLLARAAARRREIGLRFALGAGRGRIVRQLLAESMLLAAIGGAAGLAAGWWCARALMAAFPQRIGRPAFEFAGLDTKVFWFALMVSVATGLAFGLAPALMLARGSLHDALKGTFGGTRSGWRFSFPGVVIIAETALSLMLLNGAALMLRSFERLIAANPGFHPEHALRVDVPMPSFLSAITSFASRQDVETRQAAEYADLIERVRAMPGVTAAAMVTVTPLGPVEVGTRVGFEGDPNPEQDHRAQLRAVSPEYFRAMGITLLAGRAFTEADAGSAPAVAIVNDAMARKYWPGESPVGKRVNMSGQPRGPWMEVVGLVGGIRQRKLSDEPGPEIYRPYKEYLGPAFAAALIVRGAGDPSRLAPAIRHEIHTRYPSQPIGDVKLMTDVVSDSVALPRFYTELLGAFAGLAMALAAAGIYGVMSYAVARRSREVGIRMAMGATAQRVLTMVLMEGGTLVLIGVTIGIAGSVGLTRVLASQLYKTSATEPVAFAIVSAAMVAVGAVAALVPASRAARVDPMVALRDE